MKKSYSFRRSFYFETEKAIRENSISFILGTRKCGKTVCMHQLVAAHENAVYIDMKAEFETDSQRRSCVNKILKSIEENDSVIYLIDEATYMAVPDKEIAKIAGAFGECENTNTRVVFSGSQSGALEFWGHIACGGNAAFIRTGFLTYPEWLAYKGFTEVSEKSYLDFLCNVREFYRDFNGTREYLQGCLDETVISNRKAIEYVVENDADNLTTEMLLDVLYASLVKLHNHTSSQRFADSKLLETMIEYHFDIELSEDEKSRISEVLGSRYRNFKAMSGYDCKCAMRFLVNCGLTTLTYVSDELTADPYIAEKLLKDSNELYLKPEIFHRFNLTINYPMFYVDLIKNVLKDRQIDSLPKDLLGSIVECHVRSLLPGTGAFEYHDKEGREIDYISQNRAIEISVSNKRDRNTYLNILPDEYKKTLLTRDKEGVICGIEHIPYYRFIYDHSAGKELVEELAVRHIGTD